MKEDNQDRSDSKRIIITVVLIMTLLVCVTSATYAYLSMTASNNNSISGTIAGGGLTLNVSQISPTSTATSTGVMVPQKDSALSAAMNATNKCVDGNGNIVCKVYSIEVKSSSKAAIVTTGSIKFTNASATNLKWQLASGANTLGTLSAHSATNGSTLDIKTGSTTVNNTYSIGASGSTTVYLVVWLSETNSKQTDSGTWTAEITFDTGTSGVTSTITSA